MPTFTYLCFVAGKSGDGRYGKIIRTQQKEKLKERRSQMVNQNFSKDGNYLSKEIAGFCEETRRCC